MKTRGRQDGYALALTMMLLLVLTLLSLSLMTLGAVEPQIARNHVDGKRVLFAADSGVEWAIRQIIGAGFSSLPSTLGTNVSVPGLPAGFGTFTVTQTATAPGKLMLTSVGSYGTARATISSVIVGRGPDNPLPGLNPLGLSGALTLVNSAAVVYDASFCGIATGCAINGRDHRITDVVGAPGGAAPALLGVALDAAISDQEGTTQTGFGSTSNSTPVQIQGRHQSTGAVSSTTTTGANTIAGNVGTAWDADPLPAGMLTSLLDNVELAIGQKVGPCTVTPLDLYCNGNATSTMISGGMNTNINGILVVTGTLFIRGTTQWNGLIIAGRIDTQSGDQLDVRGAVILTGTGPAPAVNCNGRCQIIYSSEAITKALAGPGNTSIRGWRQVSP